MAKLGLWQFDNNWTNILGPLSPEEGGLPGLPSPLTNRTFRYRIIDFDQTRKVDYMELEFSMSIEGYVRRITENVPAGYFVAYWE
ncbi:hypothetical protein PM082_015432 [Marasmius tenuissimus]|nr:hypothetical protein PM082_015432 [Marasmius tenuissimus]